MIALQHEKVFEEVDAMEGDMVKTLMELVRIPAISPDNGGEGEIKKTEKLQRILETVGFDRIERHDAPDEQVPSGKRPNLIAYSQGENEDQRLWIVTHVDVVPAGEESLWTLTKPFNPIIKDGKIYGRGSEDNGQSLVASIFAMKALKKLDLKPRRTVALAFVADEEQGSDYGIKYLIKQKLFSKDDLAIVPDGGDENGSFIEIAEKTILWFKILTLGKQSHASRPSEGLNAHRIGMQYALAVDKMLHEKCPLKDTYYEPPESTIEPTKKEKNVDAVNIIPPEDVTCFDMRLLPNYSADAILRDMQNLAKQFEEKTGATITLELLQKTIAPKPTDPNSEVVVLLKDAIKKVRGVQPRVGGIGGGTCAAYFREINIPAVVWSTVDEIAHQPNEYAKIENLVSDAKVFACLALS